MEAIHPGAPTADRVALSMVEGCRGAVLACVEGDDTIGELGRTVDGWESILAQSVVNQVFHVIRGQDYNGDPIAEGGDDGRSNP